VLGDGLPRGTLLNVNVPPGPVRGVESPGRGRKHRPNIIEAPTPAKEVLLDREESLEWNEEAGTDYAALGHGLVSITPLRTDMTDYRVLDDFKLRDWDLVLEAQSK
jgi:5'-nucleotidase